MVARARVLVTAAALVLLAPAPARAESAAACIDAHTSGQELRIHGSWHDARLHFLTCAQSSCPRPIAADCSRWAEEIAAREPTVVLSAEGPDGQDTVDVRLWVDGVTVSERLPATAIEIDPGEHILRFEHPSWTTVEQKIVVHEGETNRRVVFRFAAESSLPPPAVAAPLVVTGSRTSRVGIAMLVVGGVAAAVATPLAIVGKLREDDLAGQPCGKAGTCAPSDVDAVRRDYWSAGVVGGVALVALIVGAWKTAAGVGAPTTIGIDARGLRISF